MRNNFKSAASQKDDVVAYKRLVNSMKFSLIGFLALKLPVESSLTPHFLFMEGDEV